MAARSLTWDLHPHGHCYWPRPPFQLLPRLLISLPELYCKYTCFQPCLLRWRLFVFTALLALLWCGGTKPCGWSPACAVLIPSSPCSWGSPAIAALWQLTARSADYHNFLAWILFFIRIQSPPIKGEGSKSSIISLKNRKRGMLLILEEYWEFSAYLRSCWYIHKS